MSVPMALRARRASAAAVLTVVALTLSACSDAEEAPAEKADETVKIVFTDDEVSPRGERVKAKAGEPLKIEITADKEGSLHVHSTPEQELTFEDGTVTHELVIDRPGVVEVESHDPDLVILQVEVR